MSRIFSPPHMPDICGGLETSADLDSPSSSDSEGREHEDGHPNAREGKAKRRKYVRDPIQRKRILEDDIWATNITVTSVDCKGCGKTLALDGRRQYYLGLWEKHRVKCAGIRRQKGEEPLPRKPRKTSARRDVDVGASNVYNLQQEKEADTPQPHSDGSNTTSMPVVVQNHCTQYRASSADHSDYAKHSIGRPHYLPVSRSMESLRSSGLDHPGNEWYWQEAPFAPPVSNDLSQGRAVYRYSTRWELTKGFGEYQMDLQAGGSNAHVE